MARLYRARAIGTKGFSKILAVKRMQPQWASDPSLVEMLVDEARMASNLSHPNIVQVLELGRDDEGYFIVMEFVGGPNLSRVLSELQRRKERLPEACALDVIIQLLRALDYAHRMRDGLGQPMNLVHRDVSPQNLLVTPDGAVKLSDFGVAKARGRLRETKAGEVKGKVAYMSPEQIHGQPLDGRSDQFAAGLILWECLAGRLRYPSTQEFELMDEVARAAPLPLAEVGVEVAPELQAALSRALSPRADDRFASTLELAEALTLYHRREHPSYTPEVLGRTVARLFEPQLNLLAERLRSIELGATQPIGWAGLDQGEATLVFRRDLLETASPPPSPPRPPEPIAPPEPPPQAPPPPSENELRAAIDSDSEEQEKAIRAAIAADDATVAAAPPAKRGRVGAVAALCAFLAAATASLLAGKALETPAPSSPPPITPPAAAPAPTPSSARTRPELSPARPARGAQKTPREPSAPQGFGLLDLDCTPGICRVELDGKAAGFTPVNRLSVPAGRRRVRLVNDEVGLSKTLDTRGRCRVFHFALGQPRHGPLRRVESVQTRGQATGPPSQTGASEASALRTSLASPRMSALNPFKAATRWYPRMPTACAWSRISWSSSYNVSMWSVRNAMGTTATSSTPERARAARAS